MQDPKPVIIAGLIGIPQTSLSVSEKSLFRSKFTLEPTFNETVASVDEKAIFPVFHETKEYFWIPRFAGFEWIEQNSKRIGKRVDLRVPHSRMPHASSLVFKGQLQKTASRPQEQAVASIIKQFTDREGGALLKAGTGMGKTVMALYLCFLLKVKTAIILGKDFLIEQWRERIETFIPDAKIGLIKGTKCDTEDCDIVLCSLKTLTLRPQFTWSLNDIEDGKCTNDTPKLLDQFSYVIYDECHHVAARTFSQVLPMFRAYFILGLSATPQRKDGLTDYLYWSMGKVAYEMRRPKNEMVDVFMYTYLAGSQREIKYQNGKLGYATMLNNLAKDPKRNGFILGLLEQRCQEGRKIIVFSARLKHLDTLAKDIQIRLPQLVHGFYTGKTKPAVRKESEQAQVIFATFTMAKEALDIKGLDTVFLTMPDGSTEQSIGRMRNTDEVQEHTPTVVDIVDPFSLFQGMSWKRYNLYKQFKYNIKRLTWPDVTRTDDVCFF
jgi:superfamily II DNA or RNA helicase